MARLPTKDDLSGPVSLRSGRVIAQSDQTGAGRGLASFGQDLQGIGAGFRQEEEKKRREMIALQGTAADGQGMRDISDLERSFDQDTDYGTFTKRFDAGVDKIKMERAKSIADPQARELWSAQFQNSVNGARNRVIELGRKRQDESLLVEAKNGIQGYQSIIADVNASDEDRDLARRNGEGSIGVLESEGKLTPAEAEQWRKDLVQGGNFIYTQRRVEKEGSAAISGKLPANVGGRAAAAMSFFQSRGYTKEQAAGIVGNLIAESNLNPSVAPGDNGTAFGIAQWRGERLTRLKRFANANGRHWQDFETQLAFVDTELQSQETAAYNALKNAKTVDEATAAFIGYERPRGWSPGNPRGGHNYSGRVRNAAMAAGVEAKPEWFTSLSPQDQFRIEQQAAAQDNQFETERAAQDAAARAAAKDEFSLRIATGDTTLTRDMIVNSDLIDAGDKATLVNSFNEKMKDVLATTEAIKAFAGGGLQVDPYDEKGQKIVDSVADTLGKSNPEQSQSLTEELVRQTGVVPKSTFNRIRAGLGSTNVSEVAAAAQSAQRISTINPAALERRGGGSEVQKAADDFKYFVDTLNLTPEQAAQRMMEARNPEKLRARKALEPAAKAFIKEIEKVDLAAEFDEAWMSDPQLGFSAGQALGIQADFVAIAEEQFYQSNGDPDLAKNRALEEMERLYGVTGVMGSPVVMKHPPERYWPRSTFGTMESSGIFDRKAVPTLDYARQQLGADIQALTPDADLNSVQLVTTPETDAMVKRGELPGYAVLYKDANGTLQTVPGKLWRPDVSKAAEWGKRVEQNRIDDARKEQTQERQKAPYNIQRPEDFLGGNDPVFGGRDAPVTQPLKVPAKPKAPEPVIDGSSELLEPTPGSAM